MLIPFSQPHDVLLTYLLCRDPLQSGTWHSLPSVSAGLVPFLAAKGAPGFSGDGQSHDVPPALLLALSRLERRLYVEYDNHTRRVRLTALGAVVALLHEIPSELIPHSR